MGQTPKALRCEIWVDDDYAEHPDVQALAAKGHTIHKLSDVQTVGVPGGIFTAPHLILSRAAHQWTPEMARIKGLLETVMQATRKRKRES